LTSIAKEKAAVTTHPDAVTGRAYRALATPVPLRTGTLLAAIGFAVVTAIVPVVDGVHIVPTGHDLAGTAQALASFAGDAIEAVKAAGAGIQTLASGAESRLNLPLVVLITLGAQVLLTAALAVTSAQSARVVLTVAGLINMFAVSRIEAAGGPATPAAWDAVVNGLLVIVLAWLPVFSRKGEPRFTA
jgi:hypothetical protein